MKSVITAALSASALTGISANPTSTGQIFAATNSDLANAHPSEDITSWMAGCPVESDEQLLQSLVPHVQVGRRFDYYTHDGSVMTETDDSDIRAPHADFKIISCDPKTEQHGKTLEKGLGKCIDHSLIPEGSTKEAEVQKAVRTLRKRLARIELYRFYKALDTAGADVTLTLNAASDPDCLIENAIGDEMCKPDSMIISYSAMQLRKRVYRQKDIANIAVADNARFNTQEIADFIGLSGGIHQDRSYLQKGNKRVKNKQVAALKGYLYNKGDLDVLSAEDFGEYNPASMARFWTPVEEGGQDGGKYAVLTEERHRRTFVYVFHYSQLITLNAGSIKDLTFVNSL